MIVSFSAEFLQVDNLHNHVRGYGLINKIDLVIASPLLRESHNKLSKESYQWLWLQRQEKDQWRCATGVIGSGDQQAMEGEGLRIMFRRIMCRSYSPAPRRRSDYSVSPRRPAEHPRSPSPPRERDDDQKRRSYSPAYGNGADQSPGNGYAE
ncbi:hypothetical protein RIF29_38827 [Crotalaria pallida]|uniref:Uncharacterized protein n=1 Tax=Crotalaria pallida TaxID=3830 RepID=A0AAN9E0Q1_CROPI